MYAKSKEIRWRKIGGGSFRYIRGKIIKPNEIFTARQDEIPDSFRKYVVALEDIPVEVVPPVQPFVARKRKDKVAVETIYEAQEREAPGWWDVVNKVSEKPINEKGMREEAAKKLVVELNA